MPGVTEDTRSQTIEPALGLPPRLLVYATPSADELLPVLKGLFPDARLQLRDDFGFRESPNPDVVPIWHLGWALADLAARAGELVRNLVYPLAMSGSPFVLSFGAPRAALERAAIAPTEIGRLDLEDVRVLLGPDAAAEQEFAELHLLASQTPQTPIEQRLAVALNRLGLEPRAQVRIGPRTAAPRGRRSGAGGSRPK